MAGMQQGGGQRGQLPPQILADQLTLSQPGGGGADYTHHIPASPPHIFRPSYGPLMERMCVDKGWKWIKVLDGVLLGRYSEVTLRSIKLSVWKVCHLVQLPVPGRISNQNAEKQKYLRFKLTKLLYRPYYNIISPKLIFHNMKSRDQTSVLLSVLTTSYFFHFLLKTAS